MKIRQINFNNPNQPEEANVEVLEDDNQTVTTINIDTTNKTEIQIKQEIKDVINAGKIKRDNKILLKQKLEGKII